MIGRIIPAIYDIHGKSVGFPVSKKRKHLFHGTFPIERYLSQPLTYPCSTIPELRRFLRQCKYVSDREQFHRKDYWIPPEEFEQNKKGDCEDFALWTWRQLLGMGYNARFVVGKAGKYGEGHAWVTMENKGNFFIIESLAWMVGKKLPRLSVISYQPRGSIEWDGKEIHYFIHEERKFSLPVLQLPALVGEWLLFWIWLWLRFSVMFCLLPFVLIKKFIKKNL